MTYALIAHTSRAGAGTTSAIDTTGASLLIAVADDSAPVPTPTDSKSNISWTKLTGQSGTFGSETAIFYCKNPTVGSGHTFTIGGSVPALCVAAFSGADTSSPFDQENGVPETATPEQAGSITPSQNDELIIAALGGLGQGASIDSGFTLIESQPLTGGVNFASYLAYLIQGTAAAVNPSWTTSTGTATPVIASFKVAGAASVKPYWLYASQFVIGGPG